MKHATRPNKKRKLNINCESIRRMGAPIRKLDSPELQEVVGASGFTICFCPTVLDCPTGFNC